MTTPDATVDSLLGSEPAAQAPVEPAPPRRRRKLALLFLLVALSVVFLVVATWYLLFRQPITELVIPTVNASVPPAFSAAFYEVAQPIAVAVAPDGSRIYVTQGADTQETVVLNAQGTRVGTLTPPTTVNETPQQRFLAVDPSSGDVWATDRLAGQVYVYAADGSYRRRFDPGLAYAGWQPMAIAFDKTGNVYIADVGGAYQSVHEFDRDGKLVRDFGSKGVLSFPNGIAIDSTAKVYIADSNNGRLLVFDGQGQQLGLVPRGTAAGALGLPRGVAIDSHDKVYVVDSVGQGVQIYGALKDGEEEPTYLNHFGTEGTVDGAFEFPNGIAVDARGRVYVADWNNSRVQVWSY
jgi:DNA-binding beta-propeller fold protein YncE